VKLHPVSVKSSEDSSSSFSASGSDAAMYTELSRLLRDDNVDDDVTIDWIDVSPSLSLLSVVSVGLSHAHATHACYWSLITT